MPARIWHFTSDTLKGFYASEVFVVGLSQREALANALSAFDTWVQSEHNNYGYWPLVRDMFDEEGQARTQLEVIRETFEKEAMSKLRAKGTGSVLVII